MKRLGIGMSMGSRGEGISLLLIVSVCMKARR
jgi:hypothetical protein